LRRSGFSCTVSKDSALDANADAIAN